MMLSPILFDAISWGELPRETYSIQFSRFISILWVCARILAGHFSRKPPSEHRCSKCKFSALANFSITKKLCSRKAEITGPHFNLPNLVPHTIHHSHLTRYSRDSSEQNALSHLRVCYHDILPITRNALLSHSSLSTVISQRSVKFRRTVGKSWNRVFKINQMLYLKSIIYLKHFQVTWRKMPTKPQSKIYFSIEKFFLLQAVFLSRLVLKHATEISSLGSISVGATRMSIH